VPAGQVTGGQPGIQQQSGRGEQQHPRGAPPAGAFPAGLGRLPGRGQFEAELGGLAGDQAGCDGAVVSDHHHPGGAQHLDLAGAGQRTQQSGHIPAQSRHPCATRYRSRTRPSAGEPAVAVTPRPPAGLGQAPGQVEQLGHARVGDPVPDPVAVPPGCHDAPVDQPLQLVGHRLRAQSYHIGDVGHAQLPCPHQRVQQPQPGVTGQHLEHAFQPRRVRLADQLTADQLWRAGILAAQAKGKRNQGARSLWSAWNVLADRRWISQFGIRPRRPAVRAVAAVAVAKATASATATVIRTPPPAESTAEKRLVWLESRMVTAYAQLDVLREAGQQEVKDRTTAVEQEQADRTADISGIRDDLANLAGGGLRLQTWGVVCLLVGTALTAFYP